MLFQKCSCWFFAFPLSHFFRVLLDGRTFFFLLLLLLCVRCMVRLCSCLYFGCRFRFISLRVCTALAYSLHCRGREKYFLGKIALHFVCGSKLYGYERNRKTPSSFYVHTHDMHTHQLFGCLFSLPFAQPADRLSSLPYYRTHHKRKARFTHLFTWLYNRLQILFLHTISLPASFSAPRMALPFWCAIFHSMVLCVRFFRCPVP